MVFEGAEQKLNRHKLLLLIDEFPSLNRMEIFADALSYMAGYGLKAYLITQDIRQIVDAYGQNESIVSNCHVRIAFAPNQVETAELLSKMTGTQTVQKASYNFSGSRFSPVMGHINASVDHIERPLMTPDEVLRLKRRQKRGKAKRKKSSRQARCSFCERQFPNPRYTDAVLPRPDTDGPSRDRTASEFLRAGRGQSGAAARYRPNAESNQQTELAAEND